MIFTDAPIVQDINLAMPTILKADTCRFLIAAIFNKFDGGRILKQVNFYTWQSTSIEENSNMCRWKLLAIDKIF